MDEATISLEQEMAAAYSTFSGQAAHSAQTATPESGIAQAETIVTEQAPETDTTEQQEIETLTTDTAIGEGTPTYAMLTAQASPEFSTTERPAEIRP